MESLDDPEPSYLYSLLIYLKSGGNLFLVDKIITDSEEEIKSEACDRRNNNENYLCIAVKYKLETAKVL